MAWLRTDRVQLLLCSAAMMLGACSNSSSSGNLGGQGGGGPGGSSTPVGTGGIAGGNGFDGGTPSGLGGSTATGGTSGGGGHDGGTGEVAGELSRDGSFPVGTGGIAGGNGFDGGTPLGLGGSTATGGTSGGGGHDGGAGEMSRDGSVQPAVDSGSALHVLGVAVGSDGVCIILPDHTVECSGPYYSGTTPGTGTLTPVAGLTGVSTLAFEGSTVCALLIDKTVTCWGDNTYGELGIGNITGPAPCYLYSESVCALTPTPVPSLSGVTAIVEGGAYACALITGGAVSCWGKINYTATGPDITGPKSPVPGQPCNSTPTAVPGLSGVTAIAAGSQVCAVLADKTVACWDGGEGTVPVAVAGVQNAVAVAAGYDSVCALLTDGTVSCWGVMGSLSSHKAYPIAGLTDVTAISAENNPYAYMCALRSDGTVWCWGELSGFELPPLPPSGATAPAQVSGLSGLGVATAISVGSTTSGVGCAVLSDGTLACWGNVGLKSTSPRAVIVEP
jgi:hypothetical protein